MLPDQNSVPADSSAHGDRRSESSIGAGELPAALKSQIESIDLELLEFDFPEGFQKDAQAALERFFDLIADPLTCTARCAMLEAVAKTATGRQMFPIGKLGVVSDFIRELVWIAEGDLLKALQNGQASPANLARLAAHPDALRLACDAYLNGIDALSEAIKDSWGRTWTWLLKQAGSGELRKQLGAGVEGKHVAAWSANQDLHELEVADNPQQARELVRDRWMVPLDLVAETYVEPVAVL